jgi:DNA polymerase I-like protein with 3'-5' exonuclease and polymerase domains
MQLRDIKFVAQVLKLALRPPNVGDDGVVVTDDDGNFTYDRGLASFVHHDGRVRTHLSQHKETGRASSYRPPLQNLSKRREDDYARILGVWDEIDGVRTPRGDYTRLFPPAYEHPVRTIFCASPGHVLVEVDYTGAELAVIAWLANDPVMIEHVQRNILPESHPDHYDIHSQTAVRAFNLDCEPTKKGLKNAGKKALRVAAKNVNFGIPYGRMAPAIARQCREEGAHVSVEETQRIIDLYFNTYRRTVEFLGHCRDRVSNERWLCTAWGRRRRFIQASDRMVVGEQERQAQNFPIQGTVADAVSRAVDNLYYYRLERPVPYRLLLQIHDAILFEVPIPHLREFIRGVDGRPSIVHECMVERVPVWPTYLDGTRRSDVDQPYKFGIGIDVQLNWGEDITEAQAANLGIPLDLI